MSIDKSEFSMMTVKGQGRFVRYLWTAPVDVVKNPYTIASSLSLPCERQRNKQRRLCETDRVGLCNSVRGPTCHSRHDVMVFCRMWRRGL